MESCRHGASQVSCSYAAVETANLRLLQDSDRAQCSAARLRPALDLWSRHICMSPMPFETISGRTLLAYLLGVACGNRSRAIDTNERRQGCLVYHDVAVLLARMSTRRAVLWRAAIHTTIRKLRTLAGTEIGPRIDTRCRVKRPLHRLGKRQMPQIKWQRIMEM